MMCFRRSVLLLGRMFEGKGLQLVSCCQAVKMRMTGSTTFTTRSTLTEEFSEQVFSKERRRLQAKLRWQVLAD